MFWDLAPCELAMEFDAHRARQREAHDAAVQQAWMTAALVARSKTKKGIPPLASLLSKAPGPRAQSMGEMKAQVLVLAAQYGYPVRRVES